MTLINQIIRSLLSETKATLFCGMIGSWGTWMQFEEHPEIRCFERFIFNFDVDIVSLQCAKGWTMQTNVVN